MTERRAEIKRKTRETDIRLTLELDHAGTPEVSTGVPFFDHVLTSLAFHGGFGLQIEGRGDIEVDAHHLVEDVGLVLGDALREAAEQGGPLMRFGHELIPMDDALAEVVIDACERPYFVYQADFPQAWAGNFGAHLAREFFLALSQRARINLHVLCRYGANTHHMIEAAFKATGRALSEAYRERPEQLGVASTKGSL